MRDQSPLPPLVSHTLCILWEPLTTRYRTSSPFTWTNNFFTISPLIFPAPEPFVWAIVTSWAYSLCAGNGAGLINVLRFDYPTGISRHIDSKRVTHLGFIRHIPWISIPIPQPLQPLPIHAGNLRDGFIEYLESDAEFERDVRRGEVVG
jgi:hypothetical protein